MINTLPQSLIEASYTILNKKNIYQEETDSTVTHNGVEYNINTLYRLADQQVKHVSVKDLEWVIPHLDLDKPRVEKSDLSAPILVTNDENRTVVLDGAHRLMKAHQHGIKTLPSIEVSSGDLIKAKVSRNSTKHLIEAAKKILTESEEPNEVDQFRQKWKDAGVDNFVYDHKGRDTIGLSSVIVPKHAQNQGHGTKYMQDLSNLADKLGKTVILTPSSDFGGTKTRLVKFYKSHGFVENKGRNKDFTISETMYRRPQEYKGQAPHQPEPISAPTEKPLAPIKDTVMSKHMKSPEFHKWFEGSKVKNGMGDPVIVYHGSPDMGKIEESGAFRHKDDGIFFTNDLKTAKSYTDEKRSTNYQEAKGGVISAHLNIKNPYYHDHQGKDWFGTEKVIADAKEKGHDGVIINNVVDHYNTNRVKKVRPSTVYVVFNPKQIKHATKNNGKHSPETENIFE